MGKRKGDVCRFDERQVIHGIADTGDSFYLQRFLQDRKPAAFGALAVYDIDA